jgi:hypothetical protein
LQVLMVYQLMYQISLSERLRVKFL